MNSGGSTDHGHQHNLLQHHEPWKSAWLPVQGYQHNLNVILFLYLILFLFLFSVEISIPFFQNHSNPLLPVLNIWNFFMSHSNTMIFLWTPLTINDVELFSMYFDYLHFFFGKSKFKSFVYLLKRLNSPFSLDILCVPNTDLFSQISDKYFSSSLSCLLILL